MGIGNLIAGVVMLNKEKKKKKKKKKTQKENQCGQHGKMLMALMCLYSPIFNNRELFLLH